MEYHSRMQVLEPPPHGSPSGASWQWRALPGRSDARQYGTVGCVLSDGRFAVFGGVDDNGFASWSCAALNIDADGARWSPFLPMHEPRLVCACAAIGGGVIVAGSGV